MTNLIPALADAHRALITHTGTTQTDLASTARKIEATLLDLVTALDSAGFTRDVRVALLNSGSLKALKKAPLSDAPIRPTYGMPGTDAAFILAQPAAYLREAMRRGFEIDAHRRIDMVKTFAKTPGATLHEAIVLDGKVDRMMANQLLDFTLGLAPAEASRVATVVAKVLKANLKDDANATAAWLRSLCVVHDPALAGPHLFRAIVAHALLGTKRPHKDRIEHKDVEAAVDALFSTEGRKNLRAEIGDLDAWLAKGAPAPKAIQGLEAKRKNGMANPSTRRSLF